MSSYGCDCTDIDEQDFVACEDCPGHHWSDWEINDYFPFREDRFCHRCGAMETIEP